MGGNLYTLNESSLVSLSKRNQKNKLQGVLFYIKIRQYAEFKRIWMKMKIWTRIVARGWGGWGKTYTRSTNRHWCRFRNET